MLANFKDFLLNIFIIFAPLVFYPYMQKVKNRLEVYRSLCFIFFSIAIMVTMSFPVDIGGVSFDFRSIPLTVGSLYGGVYVSLLLYAVLVFIRYMGDNPNNLLYAVSLIPSIVVMGLAARTYTSLNLSQKIIYAALLCTLIKLLIFVCYFFSIGQLPLLFSNSVDTLWTFLLQGVIVALYVYLIEFLNRHFQMQEEIIKSEKIKIVSEMAASVAHEIRNPLTSVRGFIQLLGESNLSEEKKRFYQSICLEELDRAQLIITDYLSLAKPEPEMIEKMNLHEEIAYLTNVLSTYANYNNIQIEAVMPDESPLYILGDRYKFRQAVINIGKNAIEAMKHGGTLDILVKKSQEHVILCIRDTGIGMTAEQLKRLGTPYYSTKEKGTGLGTMVSFGILKKMNGKIEVTSTVGKGTQCTIQLPKADAREKSENDG
ncbi:sensor histidine kinase [Paenibacillus rigui]|uniref:histidine kinase n=1 Tax=Paenibacillus rigui TaxID=554312 RepID=A0A229ULE6_9BACL|nr:sensor histidine kinase [Paenibacillus rigui]OXM84203.1 two-component sensor histidine kinase [Paenibacillus rigui]